ncbi:DUF6395 domain-containing protein [Achromobacter agilis]|uniref:Uncharacterized protein n=1 Tax=Achromobacter agilis TaxID=1353888 RepID=A0A446CYJ1_9BURK|nr:DUF6395 domain-containing protein [Achromobacter agilis]SSW72909.1 hypothetical protein AGI3411_05815 [Achromobacter agilis]
MKIIYSDVDGFIEFNIQTSEREDAIEKKVHLDRRSARVASSLGWRDVHPDLLALSAFLIAAPFAKKVLTFGAGISQAMVAAFQQVRPDLSCGPVDYELKPRARPQNGRIGLSFSGGADSFAAVELLPANTEMFFLKRLVPAENERESTKQTSAGERACFALKDAGRHVFIVESDLEFVRHPIGFADHMACAVPLIVAAEQRDLDGVAWGTIAEAAYRFGSSEYVDFSERPQYIDYQNLFTQVGLPFCNPVIGMSEVITSAVMSKSPFRSYVQSCMYGGIEACGMCKKCFRKALLDASISGQWPSDDELDSYFAQNGIIKYISMLPIKLENIYAYVTSKYMGDHPLMLALKKRVRGGELSVAWMERYIPSYIDQAPVDRREQLLQLAKPYAEPMDQDDIRSMLKWSVVGHATDPLMIDSAAQFREQLLIHRKKYLATMAK